MEWIGEIVSGGIGAILTAIAALFVAKSKNKRENFEIITEKWEADNKRLREDIDKCKERINDLESKYNKELIRSKILEERNKKLMRSSESLATAILDLIEKMDDKDGEALLESVAVLVKQNLNNNEPI